MCDVGIFDGDFFVVQKCMEVKDGQIIVVCLGDDVMVKCLMCWFGGFELIVENLDYENIFVKVGSVDFVLEGIVVGLICLGEF